MKLKKFKLTRQWLAVLLLSCAVVPALANSDHQFVPGWDQQWQYRSVNGVCALSMELAEYGEARFVASASMAPVFELQARQDLHTPGPLYVAKFAPQWHPASPQREELGTVRHIEGGGAVVQGPLATNMLLALRQGLHIELAAPSWFDAHSDVALFLPAKDLQPALGEFLRCAQTAVKVAWQEMSRSRVSYDSGSHVLNDGARKRLRDLARYVLEDASINTLYVDGHTDDSGRKKTNAQLSKRRAETVAAYLRECGLTDQQMVVRYHGDAYPVSDNSSAQGKADNRRTTVRLERAPASDLARQ